MTEPYRYTLQESLTVMRRVARNTATGNYLAVIEAALADTQRSSNANGSDEQAKPESGVGAVQPQPEEPESSDEPTQALRDGAALLREVGAVQPPAPQFPLGALMPDQPLGSRYARVQPPAPEPRPQCWLNGGDCLQGRCEKPRFCAKNDTVAAPPARGAALTDEQLLRRTDELLGRWASGRIEGMWAFEPKSLVQFVRALALSPEDARDG